MKIVLNDAKIERSEIGHVQIQIQLRKEATGETVTWQMPFKIGQPVDRIVGGLHEFAEMIRKANRDAEVEVMKNQALNDMLKRDCSSKRQDLGSSE